jgi:hypothetical protein
LRPIRQPLSMSSAWIRGAPYVPRDVLWIARMRSSSTSSVTRRADGARSSHA